MTPRRNTLGLVTAIVGVCLSAAPSSVVANTLSKPSVDDLAYTLLTEAVSERIPAHSPEWSNYNNSDPGLSLLVLFDLLGPLGVNGLLDDFTGVPPWEEKPRDDEGYWAELGYVTMEAGLVLIAPNHPIGSDWPQQYWPQTYSLVLQEAFEVFSDHANAPEPAALLILCAAAPCVMLTRRRRTHSRPGNSSMAVVGSGVKLQSRMSWFW